MKSKRFEPIHEIAENSAKDLSHAMVEAERRVVELEHQLEQLRSYRETYLGKAAEAGTTMDPVRLQNTRVFMDRLAEAQRLHLQKLGAARAEYEAKRSLWSTKRIEAETLGRAVGRFRREERHAADRREQRDGDEAALRIAGVAMGLRDSR
jgi:flagellar FliJ protein